jgi:DNA-binding MarR family transcriptional regulator
MTTLVRLLVREGLVTRERDPADGRAYVVRLTARARDFQPVAARVLAELEARATERLSTKEMARLERALRELMDL